MKKDDILNLDNQVVFPLYLCSKEIIRRYSIFLEEIDLTYTQYIVMSFFWERKTSNVKELGKIMLLDSSTLTPLLKKLEAKDFITRQRDVHDERNLVLTLTKTGEKLKDKAEVVAKKMKKELDLGYDEERDLIYSLRAILEKLLDDRENYLWKS